ncbi:MAG: PQQ-dependent sugar dehydrogenase [Cellvibrionales bacterium]|nr:PQQ-dependent sugar dehydrogenase [Cellvibrionales bacterium]
MRHPLPLTLALLLTATLTQADISTVVPPDLPTSAGPVQIEPAVRDLKTPWALTFLPDGTFLVTERGGTLWHFDGRLDSSSVDAPNDLLQIPPRRSPVAGIPTVAAHGQGGLLDIQAAQDFATTRDLFFTFAKPQENGGAGTALARAKLSADNTQLTDLRILFEMAPGSSGGRHFGSRVLEAPDGSLYLTLGDRADRPSAQDLSNHNGAIIRLTRDGGLHPDAPFRTTPGARPEIWSYGHRNPQGAALDRHGRLWISEHGARGGDEINLIKRGANYGWPIISYGRHYSGRKIGEGTAKPGMEQPNHYWDPSIAPSGMLIYQGKMFPEWQGDIFIGSLKFGQIERLEVNGTQVTPAEIIKSAVTARIRDLREAPDGAIWFLSESRGAIYRLSRPPPP